MHNQSNILEQWKSLPPKYLPFISNHRGPVPLAKGPRGNGGERASRAAAADVRPEGPGATRALRATGACGSRLSAQGPTERGCKILRKRIDIFAYAPNTKYVHN